MPPCEERARARLQAMAPAFIRMRNPVGIFGSVGLHAYAEAYGDAPDAVLADRTLARGRVSEVSDDAMALESAPRAV